MSSDLKAVIGNYFTDVNFEVQTIKIGLINDTYLIKTAQGNYILQQINHEVFQDVPGLMGNMAEVLSHLRQSKVTINDQYPTLVKTHAGETFLKHEEHYWRLMSQVPDSISYFSCKNTTMLKRGIASMTRFQQALWGFPVEKLVETIPNFHNLLARFETFKQAVAEDAVGLVKDVQAEVDELLSLEDWIQDTHKKMLTLPDRVTHHDLKFNNILFDSQDQALCLVDYDTIMPGKIVNDFAEFIRTAVVNLPEDDPKYLDLRINQEYLEILLDDYLEAMNGYLTQEEMEALMIAPSCLTLMLSIRFYTDFVQGSKYFKVDYRLHNRDRGRNQLQLFKLLESSTLRSSASASCNMV